MRRQTFVSMEIVGKSDEKLIRQLRKDNAEFERILGLVVITAAFDIANDTKSPATFPVKSGHLRGSYQPDVRHTRKTMSAVVGSIADYAPNVEFGYGQRAQPFFEPAVEKNEPRFYTAIEKLITKFTK